MKKLVIGNWKLNPQRTSEARILTSRIEHGLADFDRGAVEAVICPPHVFLPLAKTLSNRAVLGAQDVSAESEGTFTGEVSADQLKQFGVEYVIVGHSERRALGEDDKLIARKVKACLGAGMTPVLCLGSGTKKSHNTKAIKKLLVAQFNSATKGLKRKMKDLVIVYEPVWAISRGLGTGSAVDPEHAKEIAGFLATKAKGARIIYGGSVDGTNAEDFASAGLVGALLGGASLDAKEFLATVQAFSSKKKQ
jgi:triosephosphate isomerase